jgi:toxin ParE1/3/4
MAYRLARRAEADLEDIASYIAEASGSFETAERVIDSIVARFLFLAEHPYAGRARDDDLGTGRRSFPADQYVIVYRVQGSDVFILRVAHGRRDLKALMGQQGGG